MSAATPVRLLRPLAELDDHDAQSIVLPHAITALAAWNLITAEPRPLLRLGFRARDAIAVRFGVKAIGGFSGRQHAAVRTGDRLDFFLVEHSDSEMLVLTERDRHLDVMLCIATFDRRLVLTTSVVAHNFFGRAYMMPVGPIHRSIIGGDLRRLQRRFREAESRPGPRFCKEKPATRQRPHTQSP